MSLTLSACQTPAPLSKITTWAQPPGVTNWGQGMIVDLHSGQFLTPQQLAEHLAGAAHLVVGEQHDNPDHHAIELWLLQALDDRRPQGSLLLEMLEPVQQTLVDAARQALKAGTPPVDLPSALGWQKGWDWALYGPIMRFSLSQPFPVLAANLDTTEIPQLRERHPSISGTSSTALPVRAALLAQIQDSHDGMLSDKQLADRLVVQQHRDRRMADTLLAAPLPAVLFAGAFHARKDVGVPLHLADQGGRALVLILAEQGSTVSVSMADYAWFSAPRAPGDVRETLRQAAGKSE